MEVLIVAPYPPYPPLFGGAARGYHLLRTLAREHRITLLCFASRRERAGLGPLREICAAVHTVEYPAGARWRRLYQARSIIGQAYNYYTCYSRQMVRALTALLARRSFDVVQTEFSQMAYYRIHGDAVRIVDEHNVEYRLLERTWRQERDPLRRVYTYVQARKFRRDELAACRRADAVLTTSEADRQILASELSGTPTRVVPNGVDTEFFSPGDRPEDPNRLLFTGAMNYAPNADGIASFCSEILPRIQAARPETTLAIVGKEPPPPIRRLAGDRIVVTGTVPDVRPWMQQAGVFVVPLRVGSGTRLKILEALACGRAVVSTSVGCEGLEVTDGEDILIADTAPAFADAVIRCLRDPTLRRELGARGRALVERRYRWDAIARDLSGFYRELSEARRASSIGPRAAASWEGARR
ncbi:MAG: glycosyl transferase family 1 [Candidatus Rokuibacteriota bacterium]|nr:MAG: glycosyl transferase family 1 [Candidatus Rokubacteria bacterium]